MHLDTGHNWMERNMLQHLVLSPEQDDKRVERFPTDKTVRTAKLGSVTQPERGGGGGSKHPGREFQNTARSPRQFEKCKTGKNKTEKGKPALVHTSWTKGDVGGRETGI